MGRVLVFIYSIISYMIGMAGLTYFIFFIGGWDFIPVHIHTPKESGLATALLINTGLVSLFALHHSVAARPAFKDWLTQFIPKAAERSTYVAASGLLMLAISFYWQPLPGSLWYIETPALVMILTALYMAGWLITVFSSFIINHFELFGLQQAYYNLINKPEPHPEFTVRLLYRVVRHPIQLGVLMGVWFTPLMTMTHFYLAALMTIYIFIGLYYEEKDLVRFLGHDYQEYQSKVPKLLPFTKPNKAGMHHEHQ